jgi:6,7-dimethyl-8-ribityllumazine synthase
MKKILIVNSNYYEKISYNLVLNAKKKLLKEKFKISILDIPGAFEIPIAIRKNIFKFDGFIALGCVIKGKTPHFDLICSSLFNSILSLSTKYNKPIGNGVITALSLSQALVRSIKNNSNKSNKGSEAANAVISILRNGTKRIS